LRNAPRDGALVCQSENHGYFASQIDHGTTTSRAPNRSNPAPTAS
jgi:hypothetical protein